MVLFLSDVAGSEVVLILLFILIFFGSKSIPGIAKTMGKTMRQIKDASQDLQNEIKKSGVDIKNDLNINRMIEETVEDFEKPFQEQVRDMHASVTFEAPKAFEMPKNPIPSRPDQIPLDQIHSEENESSPKPEN
jgi:Sec-independent protein translocase protein TatA